FATAATRAGPAARGAAPGTETTGDPAFNSPWSFLGLPSVSFAIGLEGAGLPLAVQLIGRAGDEPRLLEWAEWCEREVRKADYQTVAKGV
ncbi:MAG: hypothetical protein ACT4QC_20785, partial [Planctomycetaceae bacterium]